MTLYDRQTWNNGIAGGTPLNAARLNHMEAGIARLAQEAAFSLESWPIWVYGSSYGVLSAGWFSAGNSYLEQVAEDLDAGAITSYAVGGRRIVDILSTLINGTPVSGTNGVIAAGEWDSTTSRTGLVVIDSPGNDIGHYPSMVGGAIPTVITTANTRYVDSMKASWRAALALVSSESRVEQSAATFGGTWTNTAFASAPVSGGTFAFTSTVGATASFSITPPQSGPLAGKVFILGINYSPELVAAGMAPINISVDGVAQTPFTVPQWEQYTGHAGIALQSSWYAILVTLPVDNAAHTILLTHGGSAGQRMDIDAVIIPSINPNPIAVMSGGIVPNVGLFTAPQISAWRYNTEKVESKVREVVAEFPNAIWVPTTMTSNGLWSGDGLHPNDRGMAQRASDLKLALRVALPRLRSRTLQVTPDSEFAII